MKVLEDAMKANQRPQFRRLGADRNKGGISNIEIKLRFHFLLSKICKWGKNKL